MDSSAARKIISLEAVDVSNVANRGVETASGQQTTPRMSDVVDTGQRKLVTTSTEPLPGHIQIARGRLKPLRRSRLIDQRLRREVAIDVPVRLFSRRRRTRVDVP